MARLIRQDATGPVRIDPQDKPVFVCACGLTRNFPFYDGSHKHCKNESPDTLYTYDPKTHTILHQKPDSDADSSTKDQS